MRQISLAVQILTQRNIMRKVRKCQHEAISYNQFVSAALKDPFSVKSVKL